MTPNVGARYVLQQAVLLWDILCLIIFEVKFDERLVNSTYGVHLRHSIFAQVVLFQQHCVVVSEMS